MKIVKIIHLYHSGILIETEENQKEEELERTI